MVCIRFMTQQIVLIFIFNALAKSLTHARQVKEVTAVVTDKEFAVKLDTAFTLQKEIFDAVPSAAAVQKLSKIGGRKTKNEKKKTKKEIIKKEKLGLNSMKVSAAIHSVGNMRKISEGEQKYWKVNMVAFSADYRSPKSHPPKNN